MQLIQAIPATILSWLTTMAAFLGGLPVAWQAFVAVFIAGGIIVGLNIARQPAQGRHVAVDQQDVEDYLRGLRIASEDAERADWGWGSPRPAVRAVDDRTAQLIVDPTLRPAEVAEMVDHVAPGAGSVVSIASVVAPTTMRGPRELAELAGAEEDAYAEADRRADAEFFARFDRIMDVELAGFRERTARVETWLHYLHGETDHCPVCAAAMAEVSAEHRQIVGREDTGAYDLQELRNLLNPVARLVNA